MLLHDVGGGLAQINDQAAKCLAKLAQMWVAAECEALVAERNGQAAARYVELTQKIGQATIECWAKLAQKDAANCCYLLNGRGAVKSQVRWDWQLRWDATPWRKWQVALQGTAGATTE